MNLHEQKDFAEKILLEIDKEIEYYSDKLVRAMEDFDFWEEYDEGDYYRYQIDETEEILYSLRLQRQKKQTEFEVINNKLQDYQDKQGDLFND